MIQTHYYNIRKKVYTLVNQTDRPRTVYIEHPRDEDGNWELTEGSAAPVTKKTANHYRAPTLRFTVHGSLFPVPGLRP